MAIEAPVSPRIAVVQRYLDAFNRADWDTFRDCLTADTVHVEPGGMEAHGPDATVDSVKVFKTAMPDLTGVVTRIVEGPGGAAAEIVWTGTHSGPLAGPTGVIPPTGRAVTVHATKVFAFEGDRISYGRHYWDMLELLGAIGVMPAGR